MRDAWLRIAIAALISTMGILGTFMWGRDHRVAFERPDDPPVARIEWTQNEVQRRPAQRLIWQTTLSSEELRSGEAVRTGPTGSARIEFIGKDAYADLEPDTVIEIESSSAGLNLDFLVGNIVLHSSNAGQDAITVQSGDQKIEVKNADVAVAKTTSSAAIDVDVIKGNVEVKTPQDTAAARALESAPKLKVLRPKRGDVFYSESKLGALMEFQWEPFAEPGAEVILETGLDRSSLTPVSGVASVPASQGRLTAQLGNGKIYFRLRARGTKEKSITSSVSMVLLKPAIPPQLLEPAPNANLTLTSPRNVDFAWANHGELGDLVIKIASTPELKDPFVSQAAGDAFRKSFLLPDGHGPFYWRVSGRLPGSDKLISSSVQKFTVGANEPPPVQKIELTKAELNLPAQDEKVTFASMQKDGLWLSWKPVQGADEYELTIRGAKTYKQTSKSTRINVSRLPSGNYSWAVIAKRGPDETTESDERAFMIEHDTTFAWSDGLTKSKYVAKTNQPRIKLAWQKGPGEPVRWRARLVKTRQPASEGGTGADQDWQIVDTPELAVAADGLGTYQAEAESLDGEGKVIAKAPVRTVQVDPAALLPAPELTGHNPISGGADGSAEAEWKAVTDAKNYVVRIRSSTGEVVQSLTAESSKVSIKGLSSGDYTVTVRTVDSFGRPGPEGPRRNLSIPEFSSVRAPKLKAIKVQ